MSRLVESDELSDAAIASTPFAGCGPTVRALFATRGRTAMSSRTSALESSKASGDALEAEIVQVVDALEYVGDRTATWHDAKTSALLEAS